MHEFPALPASVAAYVQLQSTPPAELLPRAAVRAAALLSEPRFFALRSMSEFTRDPTTVAVLPTAELRVPSHRRPRAGEPGLRSGDVAELQLRLVSLERPATDLTRGGRSGAATRAAESAAKLRSALPKLSPEPRTPRLLPGLRLRRSDERKLRHHRSSSRSPFQPDLRAVQPRRADEAND